MRKKICVIVVAFSMMGCIEPAKNEKVIPLSIDTTAEMQSKRLVDDSVSTAEDDYSQTSEPTIKLLMRHDLTEGDLYMDYDKEQLLSDFFKIELIDKRTFIQNRALAIDYLLNDTAKIHKVDGKLVLPCEDDSNIYFTDNLSGTESHQEYTYLGQVVPLNAYLVSGIYWEDWNYFFVDKADGKTTQVFTSRPYLSADAKYIVCLDLDTYEGVTSIDLYWVKDHSHIKQLTAMFVKKWVPIDTFEGGMYWANDNYLYIPVVHNADFWAADGNYDDVEQFIRLKPVA